VPLCRIDQQAVALFVVTMARIRRGRCFHGRIGSAPPAGGGLLGIIDVRLRDVGAAVAALATEENHLARSIVIDQDVRVPRAGSAVGTDLRPRVGSRIVFPGVAAGGAVYAGKAAVEQYAIDVRHIDHGAFLAVPGVGRGGCGLRPFAGTGRAGMGEGVEVIAQRALARSGRDVHAVAGGVPGDLVIGMPMIGPRRAVARAPRSLRIADPQLRIGASGRVKTEYGVGIDTRATAGIVLRHQQRAVLIVINGIGPICVRRHRSGGRNRLPGLRPT